MYSQDQGAESASVNAGAGTTFSFIESQDHPDVAAACSSFEQWHLAIYVADFSDVFNNVKNAGLNSTDHKYSDKSSTLQDALKLSQFRMYSIAAVSDSPADSPSKFKKGDKLYSLGHEVRSMWHPRYLGSLPPIKQ